MSNYLKGASAMLLSLVLIACEGRQQQVSAPEQELIVKPDNRQGGGVKNLRSRVVDQSVVFRNKNYKIHIQRDADASLPTVKTVDGETYLDNRIVLQIKSSDGRSVLDKTFTKQQFAVFVDKSFMDKAILDGLAFDQVSDNGFLFVAGISYPQSDMYIPISLSVTIDGKITMSKAELMEEVGIKN